MNMMFMSAYIPCTNSNGGQSPGAMDNNNKTDRKLFPTTPTPTYPFGLYNGDFMPHPFLVPDLFYPIPLAPGLYPHLGSLGGLGAIDKASASTTGSGKSKSDKQLNFGIEAILKSSQQQKELKKEKKTEEKDQDHSNQNNNNNKKQPPATTDIIKTDKPTSPTSPELPTGLQRPPTHSLLQAPYPLNLPPLHPALGPQYSFTSPHHAYGLFERRGEAGRGHCNPKRKRSWSRAVFSALQRKGLEKRFEVQKYVTKPDRRQLAAVLGLTDAQVKVWFQNRRMKWRHMEEQRKKREQEELRHKQTNQKLGTTNTNKSSAAVAEGYVNRLQLEVREDKDEHVHVTDSDSDSDIET